jgi:hypothetical protein
MDVIKHQHQTRHIVAMSFVVDSEGLTIITLQAKQ